MEHSGFTVPFRQFVIRTISILILVFVFSCEKSDESISHRQGELTIYADPSNENLLESLTQIHQVKFPKVKFNLIYKPENVILQNLFDTVASAAFINEPLTTKQSKYIFQKTKVHPRSTLLAYDAAIFVTSADNPRDSVTLEQIRNGIIQADNTIIFDNGNSGNYNTVKKVLKLNLPSDKKVLALDNTLELIEFLKKSPKTIGVIGLNEITQNASPEIKDQMKFIKTLSVIDSAQNMQEPTTSNILAFRYPFYKGVYFIVREPGFGIGSGFARFAGSEQGQLIVKREGLQPNFLYDRNVQINIQSVE